MSKQLIDLTGQTFGKDGRLTVIKRHPVDYVCRVKSGKIVRAARWVVKCSCGRYKVVRGNHLLSGNIQSCGCWNRERAAHNCKDIVGQIFGSWLVLEKTDQRSGSFVMWKCQCLKCDKVKNINGSSLLRRQSTQCHACASRIHGLSGTLEYKRVCELVRREREKSLDVQWTVEMEKLLCDLQSRCVICNAKAEATDHVLPLSKGYGLKPGNAVRLCGVCNNKKKAQMLSDLPEIWQHRLTMAAESFRCEWESHIPIVDFAWL